MRCAARVSVRTALFYRPPCRGYRNPEFFAKMVEHMEIDQYGTAFDPAVGGVGAGTLLALWERPGRRGGWGGGGFGLREGE